AFEEGLRGSVARIATLSGRYFAMDRDRRWERTKKAYDAIARGEGLAARSAREAVAAAYDRGETDEFITPTVIFGDGGEPVARVTDQDPVVFLNFRADRARQLTRAFIEKDFDGFAREPLSIRLSTMTQYDSAFDLPFAFAPQDMSNLLGEV